MSRHKKIALMVAPFLLLIGYIASDLYIEYKANQYRVYQLEVDGCDVINGNCILTSGELKMSIYDEAGVTKLNTTFALDAAVLFLVDENNKATAYPLGVTKSPFYWESATQLRFLTAEKGAKYKLRLIAKIKGGQYISEFYTETLK